MAWRLRIASREQLSSLCILSLSSEKWESVQCEDSHYCEYVIGRFCFLTASLYCRKLALFLTMSRWRTQCYELSVWSHWLCWWDAVLCFIIDKIDNLVPCSVWNIPNVWLTFIRCSTLVHCTGWTIFSPPLPAWSFPRSGKESFSYDIG